MSDEDREYQATDQMFALIGQAITSWSFVEQGLCNVFTVCMISCPTRPPTGDDDQGLVTMHDHQVPTAVFFSVESFRGKLGLVDTAIKTRVMQHEPWAQDMLAKWSKIRTKARKLSLKRNTLAHGTVVPAFDDGEKFHDPRLMPAYGSPKWEKETGLRPPGYARSPEQMKHLIRAFNLLEEKVRCFYRELGLHPELHGIFDKLAVRQIRSHRRLDPKRAEWIEQQLSSSDRF